MIVDREKALKAFEVYTSNYNLSDDRILLKIEHSFKVSDLCHKIAENIGMSDQEIDIAWLIGLIHDIGRFEQLRVYRTFKDMQSINHAFYGAEILFADGHIRDFIDDRSYDEIIEFAVKYHSSYRIPAMVMGSARKFTNIVRDADKIDILRVCACTALETLVGCSHQEVVESEVSSKVMETFMNHHAINNQDKKYPADYRVGHLSLVYELEYEESKQIIMEHKTLEKLINYETENAKTHQQFQMLTAELWNYLKRNIK